MKNNLRKLRKIVNMISADARKQAHTNSVYISDEIINDEPELIEFGKEEFLREQKLISVQHLIKKS